MAQMLDNASKEQDMQRYSLGSLLRLLFSWLLSKNWELDRLKKQNSALARMVRDTYQRSADEIRQQGNFIIEQKKQIFKLHQEVEELREISTKDPLTEVFNRRGANAALLRQVHTIQRTLGKVTSVSFPPFSVVFMDLDRFKRVNDTFGHDAGDKVLVATAEIIKTVFHRDTDTICRPGGDEFFVIMANTSLDQAMNRAENLRVKVANDPRLRFKEYGVTVSVGVSALEITQSGLKEDIEAAFHNAITDADYAAMHSKKHGRNAVTKSVK